MKAMPLTASPANVDDRGLSGFGVSGLRRHGVSNAWVVFACAALLIGLVAASRFQLSRGSLWEDELIAITHANEPLPWFFMEVLRNDIHPPLYFLQLDAWLAIGGHGDRWALANSMLWAIVSVGVMFFVARRVHGDRAAWLAAALFAVMPSVIWSAGTLRMYAMLPACVLAVYYCNRRWFETRGSRWLVACLVGEVLLAYVHAIEFYFIAFIVFGACAEALHRGWSRDRANPVARSMVGWLVVQCVFAVAVLPLAASALLRGSDASAPGTLVTALMVGGALVSGWRTAGIPELRLAGTIVFTVLILAALSSRESRVRSIAIPICALVVATIVALAVKPIFKQPVFAANLMPFVVLGAAGAAARGRIAAMAVGACIVVLAVASIPLVPLLRQGEAYAPAARAIREDARRGDVVVIPNVSVYWGIARYAIGASWGRPLAIMPAPNESWARLNDRLADTFGAGAPARLGLVPEHDQVDANGVRYVIGSDARDATAGVSHAWIVTRDRYDTDVRLDPGLSPSTTVASRTFGDGELLVRRFDRSDVR